MKRILQLIFLLIGLTAINQLNAQTIEADSNQNQSLVLVGEEDNPLLTGAEIGAKYLDKAGNLLKTGMITPMVTATLGTIIIIKSKGNFGVVMGYTSIAAGGITWIVCQIAAGLNMEKASRFLAVPNSQYDQEPLTIGTTNNGIGLAYNF